MRSRFLVLRSNVSEQQQSTTVTCCAGNLPDSFRRLLSVRAHSHLLPDLGSVFHAPFARAAAFVLTVFLVVRLSAVDRASHRGHAAAGAAGRLRASLQHHRCVCAFTPAPVRYIGMRLKLDRVAEPILPLSGLRAVWTNSGLLPEWLAVNPQGLATLNETGGFVCPLLSAADQLRYLVVSQPKDIAAAVDVAVVAACCCCGCSRRTMLDPVCRYGVLVIAWLVTMSQIQLNCCVSLNQVGMDPEYYGHVFCNCTDNFFGVNGTCQSCGTALELPP